MANDDPWSRALSAEIGVVNYRTLRTFNDVRDYLLALKQVRYYSDQEFQAKFDALAAAATEDNVEAATHAARLLLPARPFNPYELMTWLETPVEELEYRDRLWRKFEAEERLRRMRWQTRLLWAAAAAILAATAATMWWLSR